MPYLPSLPWRTRASIPYRIRIKRRLHMLRFMVLVVLPIALWSVILAGALR